MPDKVSSEDFVLSLLRENPRVDEINKYAENFKENDWQEIVKITTSHSLFPAFYDRLVRMKISPVPEEIISHLKGMYLLNLKKNMFLEDELFKVLDHLKSCNIPAIPLKGTALAGLIYKDIALRQAPCDMDILVPEDRLIEAEKRLHETGYTFTCDYTEKQLKLMHRARKEIDLKKVRHGFTLGIDLHWNFHEIFNYKDIHIKNFFRDAKEVTMNNQRISVPSWEDEILFIITALAGRFDYITLKYIYDLHKLITSYGHEINWDKVINKVREIKLNHLLYFSLIITNDFFHTDLPEKPLKSLRPPFVKEKFLQLWINKEKILHDRDKMSSSYIWRVPIFYLLYTNNIFDWLSLVYKRLFLPAEEVSLLIYNEHEGKHRKSNYLKRFLKIWVKEYR